MDLSIDHIFISPSAPRVKASYLPAAFEAYGHARDMDGVWRCWKDMRSRHVRPTSITLGCMVEACLAAGGAPLWVSPAAALAAAAAAAGAGKDEEEEE